MNYERREYVDLHVIDAIDQRTFERGGSDAKMLTDKLKATKIHLVPHVARDAKSLQEVITSIAEYRPSYTNPKQAIPYVHISCHGQKDGLHLGDNPLTPWSILSNTLLPLFEKTDYNVPLSLSSCWGYYGAQLAYGMDQKYQKRRPYYSLVGPKQEEKIGPLCESFGVFYYNLLVRFKSLKKSIKTATEKGGITLDYTYGSIVV
ncbi:MAG TPA: hypothetical protein VK742_21635 [Candidatus Sulfotelmatobacter sp.]|jgi:hypothetical protein|nr:hypothetical protein [Candidatus Sulfotelmatobacter sp.]